MSWIDEIEDGEANDELRRLFDQARDPETGRLDNIMRVHSLHPRGLKAHLELYDAAMRGTKTLRKVDREMIALVASGLNGCHY